MAQLPGAVWCDRDRALFVGDSASTWPRRATPAWPVWVLPYGYNMGEPIEACAPDRVIADFTALLATLTSPLPA
jgi:phosphoglycolate phosphatase